MEEYFLLGTLSYRILIWLHLGTDFLLKNSFFLLVLPLIINAAFILMPRFSFGFANRIKQIVKSQAVKIDKTEVPDTYKFAFAYSRNPRLFPNISKEDAMNFFKSLDAKIDNLKSDNAEDFEKSEAESDMTSNETDVNITIQKKDKTISRLLGAFNIIILSFILISNVYGYVYYNSLFSNYFNETPKGYSLNMSKYMSIEDEKVRAKVLRMDRYVEMLNTIKVQKDANKKQDIPEQTEQ